jgi:hypothetical protein
MKDTEIDLDIIFIDEEKEIIDICHGKAGNDEDAFEEDDVKYVLEINPGFNFRPGEEVEFLSNEMHVLDSTGKVQMKLKGGERIFSRKNTKTLVNMANRANRTKTDSDYKRLGKKIFAYLDIQDSNDPEYVYMEK